MNYMDESRAKTARHLQIRQNAGKLRGMAMMKLAMDHDICVNSDEPDHTNCEMFPTNPKIAAEDYAALMDIAYLYEVQDFTKAYKRAMNMDYRIRSYIPSAIWNDLTPTSAPLNNPNGSTVEKSI
jgi:hypothetical protein